MAEGDGECAGGEKLVGDGVMCNVRRGTIFDAGRVK